MERAVAAPVAAWPSKLRELSRSPKIRTLALTGVLAGVSLLFALRYLGSIPPGPGPRLLQWWELALAFFFAEQLVFNLELRKGESHAFTLAEVVLVAGLLYASPSALVFSRLLGGFMGLIFHWRAPVIKVAFNTALLTVESCTMILVFHLVGPGATVESGRTWLAASVAVLCMCGITLILVGTVIAWHGGSRPSALVLQAAFATAVGNLCLALVGGVLINEDRAALLLLGVLGAVVFLAYRSHANLSQRYAGVQLLYEFTKVVSSTTSADAVMQQVLVQARELLRASVGEVILLDGDGSGHPMSIRAGLDDEVVTMERTDQIDPLVRDVITSGRSVLIARTARQNWAKRFLADNGFEDAVVTRLLGDGQPIGALLVANRTAAVSTFGTSDLRLFETLANHASVALANGRLVERLRQEAREREHQALHDALTGLPNRTAFRRHVDAVVGRGLPAAVMLMDLDRFKEVNDTLGHHWGDRLLQEVARRLTAAAPDGAYVARLSGDEFAVVIPDISEPDEALSIAAAFRRELSRPAAVEEINLDVAGSIGVAMCPEHGRSNSELLKAADVAMYSAKGTDVGVALYRPEIDVNTRQRLVLAADLRAAIETGALEVWFQPKAALGTEEIVGAEALVRWRHPERGIVGPDKFIPMAEQTGLISALTHLVVRSALEECRRWHQAGRNLSVSVNIAARTLLDVGLPDQLSYMLQAAGVPPSSLILEITESGIMSDPPRVVGVLNRLAEGGIRLSIDDFGTGYSSMSYLQRLPVDEVKIDRSFVCRMDERPGDRAIVRSVVELAHSLGKSTVAEGVETRAVWEELAHLGCDLAQGYLLSEPLPADRFAQWLRLRTGVRTAV